MNEALIKFVIQDYGTLYKTDIYSYEFNGANRFLCDDYPKYEAILKTVMQPAYKVFNNFYRKKVEIYYGFKINGSDEYVKALTLFIENIEVSDDGRVATFTLKSKFAYLTTTLSGMLLYNSYPSGSFTWYAHFDDICQEAFGSGYGDYTRAGGLDKYVRFLPTKITNGNAVQQQAFLNCCYLKLLSNGKFYINENIIDANKSSIDPLNILKYPHYTKMEYPTTVVVDWFDMDDYDFDPPITVVDFMGQFGTSYHPNPLPPSRWGSKTDPIENEGAFICWDTTLHKCLVGH